eukprot:2500991-Rhodomonas_salina.1
MHLFDARVRRRDLPNLSAVHGRLCPLHRTHCPALSTYSLSHQPSLTGSHPAEHVPARGWVAPDPTGTGGSVRRP